MLMQWNAAPRWTGSLCTADTILNEHWGTLPSSDNYISDGQCTYNVTLRRVLATIVAVEKQWALNILGVCL
jgi:hypothetical protein